MRKNIYTGNPWEKKAAYCRATRIDKHIWVSGTTSLDENGNVVGKDDMYAQTVCALKKIGQSLEKLGANYAHVVRTRVFITSMDLLEPAIKAYHEIFQGIDPTTTWVAVSALVHPDLFIEIETDAFLTD